MNSPMNVEKSIRTFSAAVEDEESDWEYEYDETATEVSPVLKNEFPIAKSGTELLRDH